MKKQTTEHLQQLAWECGFLLSVDLPKLIKFASLIRSDAFLEGFNAGLNYQQMVSLKIIKQAAKQIEDYCHEQSQPNHPKKHREKLLPSQRFVICTTDEIPF